MTVPTDEPAVLVEHVGAVATVRINRPARRNALRAGDAALLAETLAGVTDDANVRVVILGGVDGWLCAGGDLAEDVADGPSAADRRLGQFQRLLGVVLELSVPVVVVFEGAAVGAGAALALAGDVCIAAPGARLILPWVPRGMVPDMGVAFLLARQLGPSRAKRLLFAGESITAGDAEQHGLVTAVSDDPWGTAHTWAQRLATGPRFALTLTKRLVNAASFGSLDDYLALERSSMAAALGTNEPAEGIAAFIARRDPVFE
ncbi:MAG: enoyl-CoA hydratase-related protein [Acidimicrobiales bacterium]